MLNAEDCLRLIEIINKADIYEIKAIDNLLKEEFTHKYHEITRDEIKKA